MKNPIIIDKERLLKRIETLEHEMEEHSYNSEDYYIRNLEKTLLKEIISDAIPLIPEIEKAFKAAKIITNMTEKGRFVTITETEWQQAALPSPEITEAMRKQFAPLSEYPKRMLVWDSEESDAEPRIVIADLGEKVKDRYIVVANGDEKKFQNGQLFDFYYYRNAKPLPEPDPIAQEIAQIRQRLAELEAEHNQQS